MRKISFTKMIASGNDFAILEFLSSRVLGLRDLARRICDRKYGVGADGLLVLEKSKIADIKMRIFNPDGTEAEMCGNGARCVALYMNKRNLTIQTKAGIIESRVNRDNVKIKLTEAEDIKFNIPIAINGRNIKINFINTGVPHTVIFVEGLERIDVFNIGRQVRYHKRFMPKGTNVDFVEMLSGKSIKVRTYERGVENETLACGTGAVASALITAAHFPQPATRKISVFTKSKEALKVYFDKLDSKFKNIWLEGKAKIVYKGCWCDE